MATFLGTLAVFAVVIVAMALGVMLSGRRLSGSCGGTDGGACACSDEKRRQCKEKPAIPNAEKPIDPAMLKRRA